MRLARRVAKPTLEGVPLRSSLRVAQLVGLLTLLRSVAYDRWITVLVSVLLIVAARAAMRGRTWGVGLALAAGVWFTSAWAIGIAPMWFAIVGVLAVVPFMKTWRALARFDQGATALLAGIAAVSGAFVAIAWKKVAWSLFMSVPLLRPSAEAQHGLALTALVAAALATAVHLRRKDERVRIAESASSTPLLRVAEPASDEAEEEQEEQKSFAPRGRHRFE